MKALITLTIVLLCTKVFSNQYGLTVGNLVYSYPDDAGNTSVTGYTGTPVDVTIPSSVTLEYSAYEYDDEGGTNIVRQVRRDCLVSKIASFAFFCCDSIKSVTISDGIVQIGSSAFVGCDSLLRISIPRSVNRIEDSALSCRKLSRIDITDLTAWCNLDDQYQSFLSGSYELYLNGEVVRNLVIPEGVEKVGYDTFRGCSSVKSVTIPTSVRMIDHGAFCCANLQTIVVSSDNHNFASYDGVLFSRDFSELIQYPAGKSDDRYDIPYGVEQIGTEAFLDCSNLHYVAVPDTVRYIGDAAFCGCFLDGIDLPITDVGYSAFAGSICGSISILGGSVAPYAFDHCRIDCVWLGVCDIAENAFCGVQSPWEDSCEFELSFAPSYYSVSEDAFPIGAKGFYGRYDETEWRSVIDANGYWHGLKMFPNWVTIKYESNSDIEDVEGEMRNDYPRHGGKYVRLSTNVFKKKGCLFQGWATSVENALNGIVSYTDNQYVYVDSDMTLYAVWVANKPILTNDNYSVIDGSLQLNWENPEAPMPPNMTYEVRRGFTDNYEAAEILTNGYDKLSYVDTQFDSIGSTSRIWYWVKPENNLFEVSEPCVTKNRYFLSVGFSTYGPGIKDKGITKDDAELAAGVAADMGGFLSVRGTSDGMCITDKYGTLANLNAAIDVCANRVKPGDIFFCYLATHGSMGTEDIEPQLLLYQGQRLMYSRLAKWCEDITKEQARFICVIMSCHSEALMNGGKIPTNETVLDNLETCGLRKCGAYSDLSAWVTSCSAEELSWKLSASAFSRFTMAFCGNGWVKGYADVDLYLEDTCEWIPSHGDGRLTLREIAEYSKKMYIGGAKESNVKINNADLLSRIDVGASTKDNNVKALPAPKNVKIKGVDGIFSGDKQIVSWDAVPDADEYRIYRQYGSDEPVLACVVQWQTTSYEDYTRWSWLSTNYKYYIQAVNASAISVKSDKVAHLSVKRGTTQLTESDVRGYFAENGVTLADDLSDEDWRNIHDSDLDGDGVIAGIESISGVSPIDSSAQFSANITFENGQPKVTPVPDLGKKRQYTIYGKESLNDPNVDWVDVTDKDLSNYHFFKVTVDMP